MIGVIANHKGGVGKSTLTMNLAVAWQNAGLSVVVIEADPSIYTTSRWAEDREAAGHGTVLVLKKDGKLKDALRDLAGKYDVVLVDSAGKDSPEMRSALLAADVLLIPTPMSQTDIDSSIDMKKKIVDVAEEYNPSLVTAVVLSRVTTHPWSTEAEDAREVLGEIFPHIMPTVIYDRKAYRNALNEGTSVVEGTDRKAAWEIEELAKQVKEMVDSGRN